MSLIVILDFDGTVVTHEFPKIGRDIGAVPVLKKLASKGKIILFTMRSEEYLERAVDWFKKHNIPLWGINMNPEQHEWTSSPKPYGTLYIDDAALGIPLIENGVDRPFVDWRKVELWLENKGYL